MNSDTVVDPDLDPTATYAVDPARLRALTERVVGSGESFTSHSPMTGAPVGTFPLSTPDDVRSAVTMARGAQPAWAAMPLSERAAVLLRFHDLVLETRNDLLDAVQIESGKARYHAFEEVADVANTCRHYARSARHYLKPRRRLGALPVLTQAVEQRLPKGVVGIVSPWNYPLSLSVTDALPALLAGNAVVLRPDQQSSYTALLAMDLLFRAGLPEDVLKVVLGPGSSVGQAVVDEADYVSFTGSTPTGRRVAQSAAKRLVGFSLELGGKNSVYIADDADLDRAVPGAIRACFASAGQLCISTERVIVHEKVADAFVERFVETVEQLRLGTSLTWDYDIGSLVSRQQLDNVVAHVDDARAKGAAVLAGGTARPDIGPYVYEPTILEGVTAAMECRDDETFGPVVSIYRVPDDDAAVQLANDTEYGLNSSVWTRDVGRGRAIGARIRTGTVNINEAYAAAWGSMGAPMGGMKASGIGRRHGAEGIHRYTESQNVSAQRLVPTMAPPSGMSDEKYAGLLSLGLAAMRRLGVR